jgi:hypothetical protein
MSKTHFENLWEMCEAFHQKSEGFAAPIDMDELILKLGLYQSLSSNKINLPIEDLQKAKSRIMGEILFFLTNISIKDNIDVFNALLEALKTKS